jgi:NADPH-dependent 2,4-dienoyl-CoA reductase/sulfur reductase-like enzyme/rhodanese-related sulfurtransferase
MPKKVLIVGGVAGGASCAARLRRLDEFAEIIMFEKGEYISFANCGLPYHIGGVIEDRGQLLLQTPESFYNRFRVDVRTRNEVLSIDRDHKQVLVKNHKTQTTYKEGYDVLVLATGSVPVRPSVPGIDNPKVMTLWSIPDMDRIIEALEKDGARSAVVVGGGFIGLELAENLKLRGISVTLVEAADQVMPPLDFDMAQSVHKHLIDNGIALILKDGLKAFSPLDKGIRVTLNSGKNVDADMAILCIGIRPNTALAKDCGLEISERGGIVTDDTLQTSDENIYAVGDIVETVHYVNKEKKLIIPLAGPANKMGRLAADNICGLLRTYKGSLGSSVAKVFDLTVACTGLNEKQLRRDGLMLHKDYDITIVHPLSHAGYYPGGKPLTLKLLFHKSGKVLGAQGVGYKGVDKRIDVIATAIKFGATVFDLEELDLCYAPPYSSAKDPVNIAGFSAENIVNGTVEYITVEELEKADPKPVVLDVRTSYERSKGYIKGSIHVPVDDLRESLLSLDKNQSYVLHCAVGVRSYIAYRIMKQHGFKNVKNLAGGYTAYKMYTYDAAGSSKEKEKDILLKIGMNQDFVQKD